MTYRQFNNLLLAFIILCSTSFYDLAALGSAKKGIELIGIGLIVVLLLLHLVYGKPPEIKRNYAFFTGFFFIALITSVFTAAYTREQTIVQSLFAEKALFFYLFYFLLHQMKPKPGDLEKIIIGFGILHGLLFVLQYLAFPKILFDTFILIGRGTIRIYLAGSDYLAICFFMSSLAFLRSNRPRYMIFMLLSFSIFVLLGGRQTMALMAFVLVLAILFAKKVRSRVAITLLIAGGIVLLFFIFQPIFQGMIKESTANKAQGLDYVRFRAAKYFLTDYYNSTIAYITGNGAPYSSTPFGNLIEKLKISNGFFLGDIGILGSYVTYGIFFIIGVIGIIVKTMFTKLEGNYLYIKYVFIGFTLSLITGSGFEKADFICALCILLYIVDINISKKKDEVVS